MTSRSADILYIELGPFKHSELPNAPSAALFIYASKAQARPAIFEIAEAFALCRRTYDPAPAAFGSALSAPASVLIVSGRIWVSESLDQRYSNSYASAMITETIQTENRI